MRRPDMSVVVYVSTRLVSSVKNAKEELKY